MWKVSDWYYLNQWQATMIFNVSIKWLDIACSVLLRQGSILAVTSVICYKESKSFNMLTVSFTVEWCVSFVRFISIEPKGVGSLPTPRGKSCECMYVYICMCWARRRGGHVGRQGCICNSVKVNIKPFWPIPSDVVNDQWNFVFVINVVSYKNNNWCLCFHYHHLL